MKRVLGRATWRRSLAVCLAGVTVCAGYLSALAQPVQLSRGVTASISDHGVQLSFTVPGLTYPKDALLPVTVSVRNAGSHAVLIGAGWDQQSPCGGTVPWVEVMNARGQQLFPPALNAPYSAPSCPRALAGVPLPPGRETRIDSYIVLRDRYVRAGVQVGDVHCCTQLTTPVLTFRLVRAPLPRVLLRTKPRVEASLRPAAGRRGPLLFAQAWWCGSGIGQASNWHARQADLLHLLHGTTVRPDCPHPRAWQVLAGWLNQRAVLISYGR